MRPRDIPLLQFVIYRCWAVDMKTLLGSQEHQVAFLGIISGNKNTIWSSRVSLRHELLACLCPQRSRLCFLISCCLCRGPLGTRSASSWCSYCKFNDSSRYFWALPPSTFSPLLVFRRCSVDSLEYAALLWNQVWRLSTAYQTKCKIVQLWPSQREHIPRRLQCRLW